MFSKISFLMILFISSIILFFPTAILFILKTVGKNLRMISASFLFLKKITLTSFLEQPSVMNGLAAGIIRIRTSILMFILEVNIVTIHATRNGILSQAAAFILREIMQAIMRPISVLNDYWAKKEVIF